MMNQKNGDGDQEQPSIFALILDQDKPKTPNSLDGRIKSIWPPTLFLAGGHAVDAISTMVGIGQYGLQEQNSLMKLLIDQGDFGLYGLMPTYKATLCAIAGGGAKLTQGKEIEGPYKITLYAIGTCLYVQAMANIHAIQKIAQSHSFF